VFHTGIRQRLRSITGDNPQTPRPGNRFGVEVKPADRLLKEEDLRKTGPVRPVELGTYRGNENQVSEIDPHPGAGMFRDGVNQAP
jgi:hypothetical protein